MSEMTFKKDSYFEILNPVYADTRAWYSIFDELLNLEIFTEPRHKPLSIKNRIQTP